MHGNSLLSNIPSAPALKAEHLTNKVTDEGRLFSDLTQAILANKVESVKALILELNAMQDYVLINKLQDIGEDKSISLLSLAILRSTEEVVAALLEHQELHVNAVNSKGMSAFMWAAWNGYHGKMCLLLNHHQPVNTDGTDIEGFNAFTLASQEGHTVIVDELLRRGFNANTKTQKGVTSFSLAAEHGRVDVVRSLLNNKVDINEQDANGCTALMFAAQNKHVKVLDLLIENSELEINIVSNAGNTAIILAVLARDAASVTSILKYPKKIDLDYKPNKKYNALALAKLNNDENIVNLLERYIEDPIKQKKSTIEFQEPAQKFLESKKIYSFSFNSIFSLFTTTKTHNSSINSTQYAAKSHS